jgi:hypothetical protein
MNKPILLITALFILSSCYNRIGDLSLISNHNMNLMSDYVLIQRNVDGVAKTMKKDALERAIEEATETWEVEFIMNCKVYVKSNGNKIKVVGDVWGKKTEELKTK